MVQVQQPPLLETPSSDEMKLVLNMAAFLQSGGLRGCGFCPNLVYWPAKAMQRTIVKMVGSSTGLALKITFSCTHNISYWIYDYVNRNLCSCFYFCGYYCTIVKFWFSLIEELMFYLQVHM